MRATSPFTRIRAEQTLEYRLLFAVSFVYFLTITIISRLLPWNWKHEPSRTTPRKSIVDEAKAASGAFVPIVFQG